LPGATASTAYYWSSTSYASDANGAWVVSFLTGYVDANGKIIDAHVRAVRGGW
jgi:hypothetical protein